MGPGRFAGTDGKGVALIRRNIHAALRRVMRRNVVRNCKVEVLPAVERAGVLEEHTGAGPFGRRGGSGRGTNTAAAVFGQT